MGDSPARIPFLDLVALHAPIQAQLDDAWRAVSRSGRFILGPEVERFEAAFAAYCGVAHAVGVGSGLDAIHLVLRAWEIGPGDEVITTAHTAVATASAIALSGAKPIFIDIEPDYFTIDPHQIDAKMDQST